MAKYEIIQQCYLPTWRGVRFFREGQVVELDPDYLEGVENLDEYIEPYTNSKPRKKAKPRLTTTEREADKQALAARRISEVRQRVGPAKQTISEKVSDDD